MDNISNINKIILSHVVIIYNMPYMTTKAYINMTYNKKIKP